MHNIVEQFRTRLNSMQKDAGLKDKPFAESIGLNYHTYRNLMGRDKTRPANQGPSLETVGLLFGQLGISKMWWLLTGEDSPESAGVGNNKPETLPTTLEDFQRWAVSACEKDPELEQWLSIELKIIRNRAAFNKATISENDE